MTHADYQALLAQKDRYLDLIESAIAFNDPKTLKYARSQLKAIASKLSHLCEATVNV